MFKGSFIKLLLGAAILVISYALPFFLIPVGSYTHSEDGASVGHSFKWNGKYAIEYKLDGASSEIEGYYKIDDKAVYASLDKDVKITDTNKVAKIKNIYTLEIGKETYKNNWALGFTIIGYVLTAWGIIGFIVPIKAKR